MASRLLLVLALWVLTWCGDGQRQPPGDCPKGQFACTDNPNRCRPLSEKCDGQQHCDNESDEFMDVCWNYCREIGKTRCDWESRCITNNEKCNGKNDCKYGREEWLEFCDDFCKEIKGDKCANSSICIRDHMKCDGNSACPHHEDELQCADYCDDIKGFLCPNVSLCVRPEGRCDGHLNCTDNSDELDCEDFCKGIGGLFCINSSVCVRQKERCDGHLHCTDGADELDCASHCEKVEGYLCSENDSKCLEISLRCDGKPDCNNSTDEMPEPCGKFCEEIGGILCPNTTTCVRTEEMCDRQPRCEGGLDEVDCGPFCQKIGGHLCPDSSDCVRTAQRCDGHPRCSDGSDEVGCATFCRSQGKFICNSSESRCRDWPTYCTGTSVCHVSIEETAKHCSYGADYDARYSSWEQLLGVSIFGTLILGSALWYMFYLRYVQWKSSVYSYPGFHKNKQPSPESSNHYDDVNPYDMPDVDPGAPDYLHAQATVEEILEALWRGDARLQPALSDQARDYLHAVPTLHEERDFHAKLLLRRALSLTDVPKETPIYDDESLFGYRRTSSDSHLGPGKLLSSGEKGETRSVLTTLLTAPDLGVLPKDYLCPVTERRQEKLAAHLSSEEAASVPGADQSPGAPASEGADESSRPAVHTTKM